MDEMISAVQECLPRTRDIMTHGRRQPMQAVNTAIVQSYRQVGR